MKDVDGCALSCRDDHVCRFLVPDLFQNCYGAYFIDGLCSVVAAGPKKLPPGGKFLTRNCLPLKKTCSEPIHFVAEAAVRGEIVGADEKTMVRHCRLDISLYLEMPRILS